ncbi:MAG: arginase, partial [Pyrinomonadaceae bacterium]|nr:arginase [Pyrinomonadaceae bacterium]
MEETLVIDREQQSLNIDRPGNGRRVGILGVPLGFGSSLAGVDIGPAAIRVARLSQRIAQLGYEVRDLGDMRIARPLTIASPNESPKYLSEMTEACENLAIEVRDILRDGEIPLVIGGDHSIAIGSIAGVASYCRDRDETLGLIWFDAHADMNTPETSPTGNIHGMPLSALLGFGVPELTHVAGFAPKLDPRFCAHIGARDIDQGERELIRRLGMRFISMREIDERGMSACMDEAIAIAAKASAGYCVTFDVDVMDPGDAPGSGTLVRGGLTYRESHLAMEK